MPRESYYQDVGNPLQRELLPTRKMSLTLPAIDLPLGEADWQIFKVVFFVFLLDLADAFFLASSSIPALAGVRAGAVFLVSLAIVISIATRLNNPRARWTYALAGLISSALMGLAVLAMPSPFIAWLHAGIIASGYAWLFTRHWTERCLSSPLDRPTAEALRNAWSPVMLLLAGIPLLAVAVALLMNTAAAGCFLLAIVIVPSILRRTPRSLNPKPGGAWTSWLTYNLENRDLPGLFISPVGGAATRFSLSVGACFVIGVCLRDTLPVPFLLPSLIGLMLPVLIMRPLLVEAAAYRRDRVTPDRWPAIVRELRTSHNPIERDSYFMGRVRDDGSPLVVPRDLFSEHGHFLGDSGSGKTALGLNPFIEQTIAFGDCSLVTIDLKADTLELLATMIYAAENLRRERGIEMPLKYLSTRDDFSTFAFNPQTQPFWRKFSSYKRTDLLTGATGMDYGPDYGPAFYSAANAGVLNHTYKTYPCVETFEELSERCGHVLHSADKRDLHPEIRRSGVHVHEVLKRLGSFAPLNVTVDGGFPQDVIDQAIDLADVFRRPQMLYCHLSSTLGPGSAPALARFVVFFLLACASTTERKVPVFLVIDEFQRMVARNFEYLLQLARSMNVGIILANQSLQDLETPTANLIPTIEANCRFRQWFSVSSLDDRRRLSESSGETVEYFTTRSESQNDKGTTTSVSRSERVMPRLSTNDIALASDHPKQSIVRISRGLGYSQYGGLPLIVESDFHITQAEYERRKRMPWPGREPGTFIPDEWAEQKPPTPPTGPIVTTEVLGENVADLFADLEGDREAKPEPKPKRRRRRK